MKQLIQHLDSGHIEHIDVPEPRTPPHHIKIALIASVISPGTERMLLSFGRGNLLQKVAQQPHRVKEVLQKASTDGILATADAIQSKLKQPIPLGYASAGVVLEVGKHVTEFAVGDHVACNGPHAEIVTVSKHLCAHIPDTVQPADAAFASLGAIALQGIRLASPTFGERFVVLGLGTIGILASRLLDAQGCEVYGVDIAHKALEMARAAGIQRTINPTAQPQWLQHLNTWTEGEGVDGVLICASTTDDTLMAQAAAMSRHQGRIIMVGVAPMTLDRALFYNKSLRVQVSCSYGPGRYESGYEQRGEDYPIGQVRWTAKRNLDAFLGFLTKHPDLMQKLVSQRVPFAQAANAYESLLHDVPGTISLSYSPENVSRAHTIQTTKRARITSPEAPCVAIIGSGNYAQRTFLPKLNDRAIRIKTIASTSGLSAAMTAQNLNVEHVTTDIRTIFNDPQITAVCILTRHDTHVDLVCQALEADKHVFVEKPLAIDRPSLERLVAQRQASPAPTLMVGFNRRFAPLSQQLAAQLHGAGPKQMHMTINAGALPSDHWTRRADQGGRVVGEACHVIDLMRFLTDAPVEQCHVLSDAPLDRASIMMQFADGSLGTIQYTDLGHSAHPKEQLHVFANGTVWTLDNFKALNIWPKPTFGLPFKNAPWSIKQDKGHSAMIDAWVDAISGNGPQPIEDHVLFEVSELALRVLER